MFGVDAEIALLEYLVDLAEQYLGDIIEEVIEKYYSDKIDLSERYVDVLEFITEKIIDDSLNGDENPERFKKIVRKLAARPYIAKMLISYLISEYIENYD